MAGERWTPGPWVIDPDDRPDMEWNNHIVVANAPHLRICFMAHTPDDGNAGGEANAHLIASAPDLYAALEQAAELIRYHLGDQSSEDGWKNDEIRDAWLAARAAMAKARGET